jgi:hypothetical protein
LSPAVMVRGRALPGASRYLFICSVTRNNHLF